MWELRWTVSASPGLVSLRITAALEATLWNRGSAKRPAD